MRSTFAGLDTALRGLMAQQQAVDVSNHNIANANTPGYSRQSAVLATTPPYTVPAFNQPSEAGQVGSGAEVASIGRARDQLLDAQYRTQAANLGDAGARSAAYAKLETVFNDLEGAGLSASMDRFWQAWQSLANHPDDAGTRAFLLDEARNFATTFNNTQHDIEAQQDDIVSTAGLQVSQVNDLARQIAALNKQISEVSGSGQRPNDLLDRRDQLLDQLAALAGTTNVPTATGAVNVYIAGRPLVARDQAFELAVSANDDGGLSVVWQNDGAAAPVNAGSLAALVDMHNTVVPGYLADLAAVGNAVMNEVNALHETGYGLNDPAGPPPGRDFFALDANGDLVVRQEIQDDPSLIAAAGVAGTPGNADIARGIAAAQQALTMSGSSATIGGFYNALVSRLGSDTNQATATEANRQAFTDGIDRRRAELSSVSLDEEVTNLVKYQHAYQAAARAMSVVDEMLDKIINGMGVVGR